VVTAVTFVLAGLVVALGALVQGTVGFGMNVLAAPLLVLTDPRLVPVPAILVACAHASLSLWRERAHVDWLGVWWAMVGRLPGIALGVAAVALLPQQEFSALVGMSVLICVGLSLLTWRPAPTPPALVVAGLASGVFGTASSIGGPPVALLYQNAGGPRVRATLAAYFTLGSAASVVSLALGGQVERYHLLATAALLPFLVLGFALSGPARRYLDAGRVRPAVLAVSAASAVLLVLSGLTG